MTSLFDHVCRQRNITGNHEIAFFEPFDYLIVGDIKTRRYLKHLYVAGRRYTHRLIGYKGEPQPGTLRRSEENILDHDRARICVYPNLHSG
jgi:hypothetical protein